MSRPLFTLDRQDAAEIMRTLRSLDEQVQRKAALAAVKAMARDLTQQVKPEIPLVTGNLRSSLKVSARRKKNLSFARSSFSRQAPYINFLEHGSLRYRKRLHGNRKSRHKRRMRNWWFDNIRKNETLFLNHLDDQITKTLSKLKKRRK